MRHLIRLLTLASQTYEARRRADAMMAAPLVFQPDPIEPAPNMVETPVYPPQGELLSGREVDWDAVSGPVDPTLKFGVRR